MFSSCYCLVLIVLSQFTEADRNSAATKAPAHSDTTTSVAEQPVIKQAIDGLSTLKDAFTSEQTPGAVRGDSRTEVPATLVWVRMSKSFLAKQLERDVDRKKPVRDYILGTTISGESRTTGKTRFVLYPNESNALGEVEFVGEVHSQTVGHNGPATLQYKSDSTFRARKQLTIGESGLSAAVAVAQAPTRLTATSLRVNLPGLRGRIGQRIAWRRVARSQAEADAIASDHTAADIRRDLDRKINESVASIQNEVQLQIAKLQPDGQKKTLILRSRSTPDCVEVALCRCSTNGDEVRIPTFAIDGNPEIAVRVHRTTLAQAMGDPQIREMVTPIIANALKKQVLAAAAEPTLQIADLQLSNWSTGGEWTILDFTIPDGEAPSPRVALAENSDGVQTR